VQLRDRLIHIEIKPDDDSNHLMWVAGHLVVHRAAVLKYLGADWETSWASLFKLGEKLTADDKYPSIDDIRTAWEVVSKKLSASLSEPPSERLSRPAPKGSPSFDGKVSGLVAFLAFHETYRWPSELPQKVARMWTDSGIKNLL
jgi:hypothetical protein